MHRSGRSKRNRLSAAIGLAAAVTTAALSLLGGAAQAAVYTYSTISSTRTFNCAILLADSDNQGGTNAIYNAADPNGNDDICAPYPFYVLNERQDVSPPGWVIQNPLAPTNVTAAIQSRYPAGYQVGQQVTQNMACYWQLDMSELANSYLGGNNPLQNFDVLVIHAHGLIGMNRGEREMLREFVDGGGTLWIEDAGPGTTTSTAGAMTTIGGALNNPSAGLFLDAYFNDNSATGGYPFIPDSNHRHPMLSKPYFLSQQEIDSLGFVNGDQNFISSMVSSSNVPDFSSLISIIGNSATSGHLPYVAAGDYGSGHVVIDNADVLDAISNPVSAPTTLYCSTNFKASVPADLKFLVNLMAWTSNNASTDQVNTRRDGFENSSIEGNLDKVWQFPYPGATQYSAAVSSNYSIGTSISGNIAYVTSLDNATTSGGVVTGTPTLRAFDLVPDEDLDQNGNTDDGNSLAGQVDPTTKVPYLADFSGGLNYDELWATLPVTTGYISPPTVAVLPAAQEVSTTGYSGSVMVEDQTGKVWIYDSTSNPVSEPGPSTLAGVTGATFGTTVPSPVYYHGWLIAAEPTNSSTGPQLYVQDMAAGSAGVLINLQAAGSNDVSQPVGSPVVASIPSQDGTYGGTDIMCYVATQQAVYAVFLGSRDEELQEATNGTTGTYKTKATAMAIQNIIGAPEDTIGGVGTANQQFVYNNATPTLWTSGNGPGFMAGTISAPSTITAASTLSNVYADYDVVPTAGAKTLLRHQILALLNGDPATPGGFIQGICVGPDNILYVTVNEPGGPNGNTGYIEAVNEQPLGVGGTPTKIKWRLALINQSSAYNGDGINYDLQGYEFIGPPVMDGNNVYAEVYNQNGTTLGKPTVAVLCLNPSPTIQIDVQPATGSLNGSGTVISEFDELGSTQPFATGTYTGNGPYTINNFVATQQTSSTVAAGPGIPMEAILSGSINGTYPISTNVNGTPLLKWWMEIPFNNGTLASGASASAFGPGQLRELGKYLYFGDGISAPPTGNGVGVLASVNTNQPVSGNPITNQASFTSSGTGTYEDNQTLSGGDQLTGLAASDDYAVAAGTTGIEGLLYSQTLITDNNRIISIDSNGNATWVLDSTEEQAFVGAAGYNAAGQTASGTAQYSGATPVVSNVALSRPCSLSQLSGNDLLFADSGNNRCVQVDRTGQVLWELSNFRDPNGLLQPGQPTSLNHPSGVVTWSETAANTTSTVVVDHYLISDTGNYRILEITDTYTYNNNTSTTGAIANPVTDYHILRGVTHTFDGSPSTNTASSAGGRKYRYVAAQRFYDNKGLPYIVAAVSNIQIAPLVNGSNLDVAQKDTAGSSLVFFQYNETYTAADVSTGAAISTLDSFGSPSYYGFPDQIVNYVGFIPTTTPATTTPTFLPLRNLRFLTVYLPPGQTSENVMIADDDGVFDGQFQTSGGPNNYTNNQPYLDAGNITGAGTTAFSFTQSDYNSMLTTYPVTGLAPYPPAFTAACAQRLANGYYLITNGASTGDARNWDGVNTAANNSQSGGCVFEINPAKTVMSSIFGRNFLNATTAPGYVTGPNNVGPLSQPSFAIEPM